MSSPWRNISLKDFKRHFQCFWWWNRTIMELRLKAPNLENTSLNEGVWPDWNLFIRRLNSLFLWRRLLWCVQCRYYLLFLLYEKLGNSGEWFCALTRTSPEMSSGKYWIWYASLAQDCIRAALCTWDQHAEFPGGREQLLCRVPLRWDILVREKQM